MYTVYYPGDSKVQTLGRNNIREDTTGAARRGDMIGRDFYFDGAPDLPCGYWRVRRMILNEYVCVRMTGEGKNMENFDIGYVMERVKLHEQHVREMGPLYNNPF